MARKYWVRSTDWEQDAKCLALSIDTELFYPPRSKALYEGIANEAKGICYGRDGHPECAVRQECLATSIAEGEEHGIWGGQSHRERNALLRRAKRKDIPWATLVFSDPNREELWTALRKNARVHNYDLEEDPWPEISNDI